MALFQPKENEEQPPPIDTNGLQMKWIESRSGETMREGHILPSGLALSAAKVKKPYKVSTYYLDPQGANTGISFNLEPEFLARWNAIFGRYPYEDRVKFARVSQRIVMQSIHRRYEPQELASVQKIIYLPVVEELEPRGWVTDWERLFWETESILHIHWDKSETSSKKSWKESISKSDMTFTSWEFITLAIFLTGLYGGVHLTIWGQAFPSRVEEIMWKASCLVLVSFVPAVFLLFFAIFALLDKMDEWEQGNDGRVFIIVESFLCLLRSPVGVFVSPEWLELFPHF
ncbi:hypothetical protein ACHAPD_007151 [Fusarium lateritium]